MALQFQSSVYRIKTGIERSLPTDGRGGRNSKMDQTIKTDRMMLTLLAHAKAAAEAGEVPVAAAVTTSDGKVIAMAENRMKRDDNALHHAEMLVISEAMRVRKTSRLDDCDLWVTLEPCTMCAGAIAHARLRRVYFWCL